ncbi:amidase [Rhodopseudomonas sp. HC1]|uniref:amidase n=1 Tax=Rhodopseudomonas infernalis TaxID=2897386 RepID=UPI001EE8A0E0|nr:amidase [Rhodopseudomonas infernalis]MCG6206585.1 amidase [Rhodopseudomonas infernalis]
MMISVDAEPRVMRHSNDVGAFVPGPLLQVAATAQGPLDGLSFAVKDLIDVAGTITGGGNPDWMRTHGPALRSAPVVERLLAAGASLRGKTITDELAFSLEGVNAHYGTPLNPACPDRIPGGSSSGSASAVAAGLVDFALGTDTGGSVRVPASFCGLYGMRPTHDAIPLDGVLPFAPSYDTVGWFARDAEMLARVGDVVLPAATPAPIETLIIVRDAFAIADEPVAAALRGVCEALGVSQEITVFDGAADDWFECYRILQGTENWRELGPWIRATKPAFGEAIAPRFASTAEITADDVARWQPARDAIRARLRAQLSGSVAWLVPTAPCIALRKDLPGAGEQIGPFYGRALTLTSIAGHAGLPQINLPVARVDDCPIGLSIIGGAGQDRALLDAACRLSARLTNRTST